MNSDLNSSFRRLFEPNQHFKIIETKPGLNFIGSKFLYFPDKRPNGWRYKLFRITNHTIAEKSTIWYNQISVIYDDLKSKYNPNEIQSQKELTCRTLERIDQLLGYATNQNTNIYLASSWSINESDLNVALMPTPNLLKKISSVGISRENTIGVHIRRTDHTWSKEHSTLTKFVEQMQKVLNQNSKSDFFVASDDEHTIEVLMEKFPGKIKTIQHKTMDRNNHEGIDTAVIDLFCLAQCNSMIGSYMSSFSDLAAQLGQIKISYAV